MAFKDLSRFLNEHRAISLGLFLIIIWGSLLTFWWFKADEVTKDPCSICAERHNDNVICSLNSVQLQNLIYLPNGSISKSQPSQIGISDVATWTNVTRTGN